MKKIIGSFVVMMVLVPNCPGEVKPRAAPAKPKSEVTKPEKEKKRVLPTLDDLKAIDELRVLRPRFKSTKEIAADSPFGVHLTSATSENVGDPKVLIRDVTRAGYKWIKDYMAPGARPKDMNPEKFLKRWEKPRPRATAYLDLARKSGLKIFLRLSNYYHKGHGWSSSQESFDVFAKWCALQVKHYKPWCKDWELCNELNMGNANPKMKAKDYARLCNTVIPAIKAVDPEARVWVGSTAMLQCLHEWPYPWIPKALDAGMTGDGFSFHPYCQPYVRRNFPERGSQFHPWDFWRDYAHQIADLRARLDKSKLTKGPDGHVPIACTEAGWPTHVNDTTWVREISLLTQAKYEQRAMLLDFWLGVRPRACFIFNRPFHNIYHLESKFQLVEPYHSNIMNWNDPKNRDGLFRPAYFAAAAVCSNIDDTLVKTNQNVTITGAETLNPQIMTFERVYKDFHFAEVVILVWAGVPAEDRFRPKPVNIKITEDPDKIACAPIGYSLLPVGVKHSTMARFDWKVVNLPYELTDDSLNLLAVPLSDAPYVIKYIRKLPPGSN